MFAEGLSYVVHLAKNILLTEKKSGHNLSIKSKRLNEEFQRIARKDKKAFFNEQWKEIEENNRMGKTKDDFKKVGDIKGTFHTKAGIIKDRNNKDLNRSRRD